jgi:hypothetical protein
MQITMADFEKAVQETEPANSATQDVYGHLIGDGLIHYAPSFDQLLTSIARAIQKTLAADESSSPGDCNAHQRCVESTLERVM